MFPGENMLRLNVRTANEYTIISCKTYKHVNTEAPSYDVA